MSMFAMSQQHPYAYGLPSAPTRQYSTHGTSSAFSSSAHPDEDWTKISDLAERRRIQNRIAQRNYRKKLKRRLEDLERRAGSSDEGEPEKSQSPSPGKSNKRQAVTKTQKVQQQAAAPAPTPAKPIIQNKFTSPMEANDELIFGSFDDRERSHTPPVFTYASYPAPDELLLDPYGSTQHYPTMSAADTYPNYLASSMAHGLPSLTHYSEVKREMYPAEDNMSSYMSYGFVGAMDIGVPNSYDAHTPPLSHSYDHSASGSESSYEYPSTPLSIGSPGTHSQH